MRTLATKTIACEEDPKRWWHKFGLLLAATAVALATGAVNSAPVAAAPPVLWETCKTGEEGGQCSNARGVAVNRETGHIVVADSRNDRINELNAWGVFVKTWGWDVVASGSGDTPADEFEICVPADGDVCKAGVFGSGPGQLARPQGVALDSSGNVYVADWSNRRVQKFSASGEFLSMFGGGVNQGGGTPSNPGNVCTAAHVANGDTCGAGASGPPPNPPGQFGFWVPGDMIAITSDDKVYVGDEWRIQRFDVDGNYQDEIALPGEMVQSLASDTVGDLFVTYADANNFLDSEPNVRKLDPATGTEIGSFAVANPRAIAPAPSGDLYAFDKDSLQIRHFDSAGAAVESFGTGFSLGSTGLAAGDCGEGDVVYFSNNLDPTFVRAYGPPPDPELCGDPPEAPPSIDDQYAAFVGSSGAHLGARINPHFWADTTYFVQYGSAECLADGWESPCVEEYPAPPGPQLTEQVVDGQITVDVELAELDAGTEYGYRFVAASGGGGPVFGMGGEVGADGVEGRFRTGLPALAPLYCPDNQQFREGAHTVAGAALLPDCRAYEMVSPVDKNGGYIDVLSAPRFHGQRTRHDQSADDGEAFTYSSASAFGDTVSAPWTSQYLAHRDPQAGWSTKAISPERKGLAGLERYVLDTNFQAFSKDLSVAWLLQDTDLPLASCAPEDSHVFYRRDNVADTYRALNCGAIQPGFGDLPHEFQGYADNGCDAVFRTRSKLPVDASLPEGNYKLYQAGCEGPASDPRLVSVLPGGGACAQDAIAGSMAGFTGAGQGFNDGRNNRTWSAFSADAKRLYWSCGTTLYLRTDPDPSAVGEPGEMVTEVAAANASFQVASVDGARALYVRGGSLRLFDAEAGPPASSTIAGGVPTGGGAAPVHLLGASEDARRAYFVSTQALTGGQENSEGQSADAGQNNLYLYEEGVGGPEFTFVARLAGADLADPSNGRRLSPVHPLPFQRASRVSPDGSHAVFMSTASITGQDNTDLESGEANAEVFLFDADARGGAGETLCLSCNPSGARSRGRSIGGATGTHKLWAASRLPGWLNQLYAPRALAEDGSRVFFESFQALVPRDTNDKRDVYQWSRAADEAECVAIGAELFSPRAKGCLSLISSGKDEADSGFVDADRSGDNVFIRTGESLLGIDPGAADIYSARVDGGFAPPPPPAAVCGVLVGACQGGGQAALATAPATSSPLAGGNSTPQARKRLHVGSISRKARRRAARTGMLRVRVRTSRAGLVRVLARAKIGKRARRIAGRSVRARKAGAVTVELRLNRAAKRHLRRGRALRVTLRVASPGARTRTATVRLKRGRRS